MIDPTGALADRYATIVEVLIGEPMVTFSPGGRGFGSSALKIDNKIFAMLFKGELVVKLPRLRVDALIASGDGQRFDPGHGRLMKEWVTVEPASGADWLALAREAMTFVAPKR